MFEVVSSLLKYIFTVIIYLFIFSVIRLIYLDIKSMNARDKHSGDNVPYLKLINQRERLSFKMYETYALSRTMVVGRSDKAEIPLKDPFISSIHAQFKVKNAKVYLEDLGSRNGTFVNGKSVIKTELQLQDGDRVSFGQIEFLFLENTN